MLKKGDTAPEFELSDGEGNKVKLKDLRGKKIALYFYPRDNTPGCTTEASEFRDGKNMLERKNAIVLGVSLDSQESHKKFADKLKLNFPLLSGTVDMATQYGAYGDRGIFGKGIKRTTVIIDENGKVEKVFEKVKVAGHCDEVANAIEFI